MRARQGSLKPGRTHGGPKAQALQDRCGFIETQLELEPVPRIAGPDRTEADRDVLVSQRDSRFTGVEHRSPAVIRVVTLASEKELRNRSKKLSRRF